MNDLDKPTSFRVRYKVIAYVAAWFMALFATNPDGGLLALAWMFPLGLAAFINQHWANGGGWGVFIACVAIYVVHGYFYFRARTRPSTILLLSLLVLLLVCNVSGCRAMLNTH